MSDKRSMISMLYRPTAPKTIRTGNAWSSGGSLQIASGIDLSLPLRGIQIILKFRCVIGGAAITTPAIEGWLNLISRIRVVGINKRQNGNVTLWDTDMATAWMVQHLFDRSVNFFSINAGTGETHVPVPTTPLPAAGANGYINGATGTYDVRIGLYLPFHPFGSPAGVRNGFVVRKEEFSDTLQIQLDYGQVSNGAVAGALGTPNAATTFTFTSYGSGAGSPTVDVYGMPMQLGDLRDSVLPGLLTRTTQPLATLLQAAGTNISLLDLQRQKTTRVYVKVGTNASTSVPAFTTVSDTNLTQIGLVAGGNRQVRDVQDIFAYKQNTQNHFAREPIQGYNVLDFIESGNPDAAYPADQLGAGVAFQLYGTVAGVANAYGIVMQEQMLYAPDGELYS